MTTPSPSARRTRRRTPPPAERQVDAERTRALLLEAALEEFAGKGYAGARIRDIASRAGVSKDLIAYHFDNKEGIYRAVQHAWLDREDAFADPDLPLSELVTRYLHDALDDPRRLRLLLWRGLSAPHDLPPDTTAGAEDLASTEARQAAGELPGDIEPAALRLMLLALVAAPVAFPHLTHRLFGVPLSDPGFEGRYADDLRRIIAHLSLDQTGAKSRTARDQGPS